MKRLFVSYFLPALMLVAACGGASTGGDGGVATCVSDGDCPVGQSCIQGVCTTLDGGSGCSSDEECPEGQSCIQGVCVLQEAADGGEAGDGGDGADGLPAVPDISIEPEAIDFGAAPVGTTVEQKLVVANEGGAELTLFSVTLEQGSSAEFGVVPAGNLGRVLGPGESFELLVTYTPADGVADTGALLVSSDDPDEALVRVPLSSSYKGSSEITATADPAALGPDLAVLDFGSVSVGQMASRELFVKNTGRGSAMLEVQQVRVDPAGSLDFSVEGVLPDLPAWLSPYMGTCTSDSDCPQDYTCLSGACTDSSGGVYDQVKITVGFTPQRAGEIVEALVVVNDEDDAAGDGLERPLRIVLRGEGTQPAIAFEPARVDFGRIFAGQIANAELLISNPGSEPLAIQSIDLQDQAVFGVDTTGTVFNLAPGEQTHVVLSYTPTQPGIDATVLVVTSNAPGSPHEVPVEAEAVAPPVISVSPQSIDFGQVQLTQLASASLVVANTGPNPLEITSISLESSSSPSFSVLQGALPPIDGGGQGRIDVVFAPQDAGVHQGTVEIRSNDPAQPLVTVSLAGTGVDPELAVAPASIDFGDIYVGYRAGPVVLTVSNTGSGTLDVLAIGTGTGTEADFQLESLPVLPASLSPGQSVSCEVYFTPLGTGPRAGSIQIVSNDVDNPLVEVPLAGNGTDCPAGWWDADGDPSNGCEYRCDLTNGGVEDCDGVDNDCDRQTDEDLAARACTVDNQYGSCTGTQACGGASGWGGCNAPAPAPEVCDSVDNDCDGLTDWQDDSLEIAPCENQAGVCAGAVHERSSCRAGAWAPCGDIEYLANDSTYGPELCDGLDNDCDGQTDEGLSTRPCLSSNQYGTCYGTETCGGSAGWTGCDAATPEPEVCDGADNDCDGATDSQDGSMSAPPCEKQQGVCAGAVHRLALCQNGAWQPCEDIDYLSNDTDYGQERCDGLDNDCDGATDEDIAPRQCSVTNAYGTCYGTEVCDGAGQWTGCTAATPGAEVCDGADNNCNGLVDAADGTLVLAPCELQDGVCAGALHRPSLCQGGAWLPCQDVDYGPNYGVEFCGNAFDEDCSGRLDDKDTDGDGYKDAVCTGGDDCDDLDPQSHPGAAETQDARDNDCDGLVDEGLIPLGAVIVTEIMNDPAGVPDSAGEWFEVTNVWQNPVNLHSFYVRDLGIDYFSVNEPSGIVLSPGESAVFCINADGSANGGVSCDYDYDNFLLAQGPDEIVLELDGVEIDRVEWDGSWPSTSGHSKNLDPAAYDSAANDSGANWCNTPANDAYLLDSGDWATPGAFNPTCSGDLAVLSVEPTDGIDAGGEQITIIGAGFTGATAVRLDGVDCLSFSVVDDSHIACTTPPHAAGDVDVTVERGVNLRTLVAGYRYTAEAPAGTIDWCVLQWPPSTTTTAGTPTELLFGRVYQAGVTEPAGPPSGITAQVGYGPQGTDPRVTPGWLWFDATWNPSCPDCGNDDEFMRSVTVEVPGGYSYAYRFSTDGGYTFTYCDLAPGTSDGFSAAALGTLTVQ